jgi:hypothetical protein
MACYSMRSMATKREDMLRHEKGKALVRALHLSELQAAGAARGLALHEADQQLDKIARLLPDALQGGISMTEIARVTNVSRPTLYELRGRYSGSVGDLRLAILQAVITRNAVTAEQLAERLGRPCKDINLVVDEFLSSELLHEDVEQVGEGEWEQQLCLTLKGLESLEHWQFEDDVDNDGGADK